MSVTVQELFVLLRKNWRFFLICGLAGSAAAFSVFRFWVKPIYASTVKFCVAISVPTENSLNDLSYAQKAVKTCIELLKTDSFFRSVSQSAGLTESTDDLRGMTDFTVLDDTEVFEIRVSSHSARHSRLIADTMGRLAPGAVRAVEPGARLRVIDPAGLPLHPDFPNLPLDAAMGFLLGACGGAVFSLWKFRCMPELPDQTSRHPEP